MYKLIEYFEDLEDPRSNIGKKHKLIDVIVLTIYGILLGQNDTENISYFLGLNKEYFEELLSLENGIPSADTFLRVYKAIKPESFMKCFSAWVKNIIEEKKVEDKIKLIPIDGKAIKSSTDKVNKGNIPYVVSAYLSDIGISIGQLKVDDKSNEIKAIPDLLDLLDIKGAVITIDAIGTQTKIVNKIVSKEGYYCLCVKDNQEGLNTDIKEYFEFAKCDKTEKLDYCKSIDKDYGRIETRETYISSNVDFIDKKWTDIKIIIMTINTREVKGKVSVQEKYYISNLKTTAKEFAKITRGHWSIENNLHWVLDVHFREDSSKSKQGHSIHNLSLIRKICYNLVKLDTVAPRKEINKKIMWYQNNFDNLKNIIFDIIPDNI